MKISKIKELDNILGIRNSCESFNLNLEKTNDVIGKVEPMYNDLCSIFNIKEQKLKKQEQDPKVQTRKRVKYILQQIYEKWNGSKFTSKSKQLMIDKKRIYTHIFCKDDCGTMDKDRNRVILSSLIK
jgi:hypothetical protein